MKVLWQRELECGSNVGCSPCAVVADANDNKLLIFGIPLGNSAEERNFWLWETDTNGIVLGREQFGNAPKNSAEIRRLSKYGDIAVKSDKNIFVLGDFDGDALSSLPIMNRKGVKPLVKNVSNSRAEKEKKNELILKMKPVSNGSLVLAGRQGQNGLLIKLDYIGNEVWEKTFDLGQTEIFTDVVVNGDEIYVVGYSGHAQGKMVFDANSVQNFLLLYDSNGQLKKEEYFVEGTPFPTETPQISRLSSGTLLVVYDKSKGIMATDLNVRAYSPDLKLLWETQILKTEGGLPASFRIIAVSDDKFFVGIVANVGELRLAEYTSDGKLVGRWTLEKIVDTSGGLRLVELDKKVYTIFSTLTYDSSQKKNIKVLAFPIK